MRSGTIFSTERMSGVSTEFQVVFGSFCSTRAVALEARELHVGELPRFGPA